MYYIDFTLDDEPRIMCAIETTKALAEESLLALHPTATITSTISALALPGLAVVIPQK
jgi:hypothetical protein